MQASRFKAPVNPRTTFTGFCQPVVAVVDVGSKVEANWESAFWALKCVWFNLASCVRAAMPRPWPAGARGCHQVLGLIGPQRTCDSCVRLARDSAAGLLNSVHQTHPYLAAMGTVKEISLLEMVLRSLARIAAGAGIAAVLLWLLWVMLDVRHMNSGFTLP